MNVRELQLIGTIGLDTLLVRSLEDYCGCSHRAFPDHPLFSLTKLFYECLNVMNVRELQLIRTIGLGYIYPLGSVPTRLL